MQVIIHRGTHQIGGMAVEINTASTRIVIDMGDELGLAPDFSPQPLMIPGVTDSDGSCDGVLFTHNHGDHVGQMKNIRDGIPLYMGHLAKDVLQAVTSDSEISLKLKIQNARTFEPGKVFTIGDIAVTPFSVDHSACDSYMFLMEGEGKRILHTGDFRTHGFRGKATLKTLEKLVGTVDVLITEGTTLSRGHCQSVSERELQQKAAEYQSKYKYVFVLSASTNLERICALSKSVPRGRYFVCDRYQSQLLDLVEKHWSGYSNLYRNIKKTVYGENLLPKLKEKGFLMMVRDNRKFREIIRHFPPKESLILYSMWDGYRSREGSTIPDFLSLAGRWEPLHTSGHAGIDDLKMVIETVNPEVILPIHTDCPDALKRICPDRNIVALEDGEEFKVQ